jgi:hypothetical protein
MTKPRCVLCGRPGYLHGPEFNPLTGEGLLVDGATGLRCAGVPSCTVRVGGNRRSAAGGHRSIPDEVVKRARDYDHAHWREDPGKSWDSVPPDQVRRLLWGAYGGGRPWPLPPAPAKLACFFCDGETYSPDGICGQCERGGKSYGDEDES